MSEQTIQKRTSVFDPVKKSWEVDVLPVLAAFVRGKGSIGLTEGEITKESGLTMEKALYEVAKLEREGFVRSFLCQEGTSGPYARRYKLADGIELKLEISRPA